MSNPAARPLFDLGNTAIRYDVKADLGIGKIDTPAGQIGFATIRLGNATMSVPLTREEAVTWADLFCQLRDSLSSSGLVVASTGLVRE
jgi:hypothetical protein